MKLHSSPKEYLSPSSVRRKTGSLLRRCFKLPSLGSLYACLGSPDDVLVHPVNSVGEYAS